MAKICIVPDQDWSVLREYLGAGEGVILIPAAVLSELPEEKAERVLNAGDLPDYNFGGEPDVYVDLALSPESYALQAILGEEDNDDGE